MPEFVENEGNVVAGERMNTAVTIFADNAARRLRASPLFVYLLTMWPTTRFSTTSLSRLG